MLTVIREGIGRGATRQYDLLKGHWVGKDLPNPTVLYFNAFTRDKPGLEKARKRGLTIVSRVGGWHFGDSAETTQWVLERSDAVIYVSDYTRRLAHKQFKNLPDKEVVITNAAPPCKHESLSKPPRLLVRAGGLGYPIWKKHMLSRSLSIFALHDIWPTLRAEFRGLRLTIRGRAHHKIKEKVKGEGIRFVEHIGDEKKLHAEGSGSAALVHLIIGDHSPNTVAEMVGEGRPVIVLDKGGARETAGRAGIVVRAVPSTERSDLDVWWPLDEQTYRPNLDSLHFAIYEAIRYPEKWRERAKERAKEISPKKVAGKYLDFIRSL